MLRRLALLTTLTLLTAGIAGCVSHTSTTPPDSAQLPPEEFEIAGRFENLRYTPEGWPQTLNADLILPERDGLLPVVITIHGGGWARRHRGDMDSTAEFLARHGFAVLNISYRFAPQFTYPAQLQDVQQALSWIRDNAGQYRLDISRINLWGYSSGAHLATLTASRSPAENGVFIRAVVGGGTPADLRKYQASPLVSTFMGGQRDEMPERYADASPAANIEQHQPPVFLYHGKLDTLVKVDQAQDYFDALVAKGVDAELLIQGAREHATMFVLDGVAKQHALRFLHRQSL